jgi:hypothetical protein
LLIEDEAMNANELIKHAPEIAKAATAVAAAVPFTAIVKRMLGPAADELAEMWRDQVRLYRYERQLKCVEKAERMAQEAGFTPQAVPPKILFSLLEGASFEENEDLHTMWSALLANAASPDRRDWVRPGYIALLRQMSPDEAGVLNWIFDADNKLRLDGSPPDPTLHNFHTLSKVHRELCSASNNSELSHTSSEAVVCLSSLEAARLILQTKTIIDAELNYGLTYRGSAFVIACRPPQPKK